MNVLFVLHNDMNCNSASHVDGVARELAGRGLDCVVTVPDPVGIPPGFLASGRDPRTEPGLDPGLGSSRFAPHPYRLVSFSEARRGADLFANGRGPDVMHVWCPRERNRRLHIDLSEKWSFRTFIHLEDNEDFIARSLVGAAKYDRIARGAEAPDYPAILTHPVFGREFMRAADGFTLLIERLGEMTPPGKPTAVFWPATDPAVFHPRARNDALRAEWNIPPETCVLTYHGNVHSANFREVRSLYLATALLNREGIPTRLVRIGSDHVTVAPEYKQWCSTVAIELGFVADRARVVDILATADVFVQPGTSDPFNDFRFPSKLPEFFALGRPVVLPRTNIGLVAEHGRHALVLDRADGPAIADAVTSIRTDQHLCDRLTRGAREFALRFSWEAAADAVLGLYESVARPALKRAA